MWSLMGREVADATKVDGLSECKHRWTGGRLGRHQGARFPNETEYARASRLQAACSVAISGPDPRGLHKEPWQSVIVVPNAVLEGFGSPGHLEETGSSGNRFLVGGKETISLIKVTGCTNQYHLNKTLPLNSSIRSQSLGSNLKGKFDP